MHAVALPVEKVFATHWTGAAEVVAQLDPAGQATQAARDVPPVAALYVPVAQAVHVPAPAAAHVPAAQVAQLAALEAVVEADAVPALHKVHDVDPAAAHFPAPHATGEAETLAQLEPAGHVVHVATAVAPRAVE